jgi:hypothetical protein
MAAALCITSLLGNKAAKDKDRFMNYIYKKKKKTHVNQITTGVLYDRKIITKTDGFHIIDFVF